MKKFVGYIGLILVLASVIAGLFVSTNRKSTQNTNVLANIESIEYFRDRFNAGIGQPRLVLLVSPT